MTTHAAFFVVALASAENVSPDALQLTASTLQEFGIGTFTVQVSAGNNLPVDIAEMAELQGWSAVVVASGGADLPEAIALAVSVPVIRVPVEDSFTSGLALLYGEEGNLPAAKTVDAAFATVAIGSAGAKNAALFVVSYLALEDDAIQDAWEKFRAAQTETVLQQPPPTLG